MPHLQTLVAHAGCHPDSATGAVTPPIHLATTFERDADGTWPSGYIYSRNGNPTRDLLELTLAGLEGGSACAAFSSGMAAASAVFNTLSAGDHVLIPDDVYYGVRRLIQGVFGRWGLTYTSVDFAHATSWKEACRQETKLIWIETPSNPLLRITDIAAVTRFAKSRGIPVAIDGTWGTPLLQRPLELGADLVVHSVTKYLAGHSDVLGGAVIAREPGPQFDRLRDVQTSAGAVMDPFSAWLTLRGVRSLGPRLAWQCATAGRIAGMLEAHPMVERVHYPGLASHPGHLVAERQMSDFGGMVSFEVAGNAATAMAVAAAVRVFRRATSLGGTESLIEHRASVEAAPTTTPQTLLRVSVGLEHPDDLLDDLDQALRAAAHVPTL